MTAPWHEEARRLRFELRMTYAEIADALGRSDTHRLYVVLSPTGREKYNAAERARKRRQRERNPEAVRASDRARKQRWLARKAAGVTA